MKQRRLTGQSLSEYSLTISLVTLVAISALMLLGNNITQLLQSMSGMLQPKKTIAVAEKVSTETSPSVGTAQSTSTSTTSAQMKFTYDPVTGKLALENLDSGTSGKITTSANGTEMASLALKRLIAAAKTNDGEQAGPDVTGLMSQLADLMHEMALQEASMTLPPSSDTSSKAYRQYYDSGFSDTKNDFTNTFRELQDLIADNPKYSQLMSQVNDYVGIASSIAQYNYSAQYYPGITPQMVKENLLGTDLATTPLSSPIDPNDIQGAIDGMESLAKK